jgi:hypothetical protein
MIRARLGLAVAIAVALIAATGAVPAEATPKERTCFYYANSGWGLWATRNVSCKAARHVYNDATRRIQPGRFNRTIRVDGYRCTMRFDGGGDGTCTASNRRRIRFTVP